MEGSSSNATHQRKIQRTLIHLSFVYFFIFASYKCLENIQTSINFEEGIGTFSLSVLYGAYTVSSLFIGPLVVSALKPKWALFIALFAHTLFILANLWPTWASMITASFILGICSSFIWITQGTYVNNLALMYTKYGSERLDIVLSKFLSIFFVIYGIGSPLGNLVSSLVLSKTWPDYNSTTKWSNETDTYIIMSTTMSTSELTYNVTSQYASEALKEEICGANHCPYMEEHLEVIRKPDQLLIYIMIGILLLSNITGIVLCFLLENVPVPKKIALKDKILKTAKILKCTDLWLLIPIFFYTGIINATFYGSFTQSYISCPYSVGMVGFVMMAEGTAFCVTSMLGGVLSKMVPRQIQMAFAIILCYAVALVWLFWQPLPDQLWVTFVIAIGFGMLHGLTKIHINAVISLLFPDSPEAAFGHMNVWGSLGHIVAFAYNPLLCFDMKTYCFLASTAAMTLCYIIIEIRLVHGKKYTEHHIVDNVDTKMDSIDK